MTFEEFRTLFLLAFPQLALFSLLMAIMIIALWDDEDEKGEDDDS